MLDPDAGRETADPGDGSKTFGERRESGTPDRLHRSFSGIHPTKALLLQEIFETNRAEVVRLSDTLGFTLGKVCLERHENEENDRDRREYFVRREFTGLPDRPFYRVLFLADTSASIRSSSSWSVARQLVKNWLQFFPVQECALVAFNGSYEVYEPDGLTARRHTNEPISFMMQLGTLTKGDFIGR
jgi:hypothetical protein